MAGWIALVGGNEFRRDCEPMDRALLARLVGEPRVVIVPTAAAHENPALAAENGLRYFRRLGARADAAMIVDVETARRPSLIAPIQSADMVYFTGGDPVYLLETMRGSPAWQATLEVVQRGGAVAGSSAGAMMCGGRMWSPAGGGWPPPLSVKGFRLPPAGGGWREGLGLVAHIAVIPHHATLASRWNAERMRSTLPANITLVGIDEATALVGFDHEWQALGQGEVAVYRGEPPSTFAHGQSVTL